MDTEIGDNTEEVSGEKMEALYVSENGRCIGLSVCARP
jgi:hypothetical protein